MYCFQTTNVDFKLFEIIQKVIDMGDYRLECVQSESSTPRFGERVQGLLDWPLIGQRLAESVPIIQRGREPYFFLVDRASSPVYEGSAKHTDGAFDTLLRFVAPQYRDQLDQILLEYEQGKLGKIRKLEAALLGLRAMVHFHPDNTIEPSLDDLDTANLFYQVCRESGYERPLQVIGRGDRDLDILVIDQTGDLDAGFVGQIPIRVERNLVSSSLPRYLEEQQVAQKAVQNLRRFIGEAAALDPDQFFAELKKHTKAMQCQEEIGAFRQIFRSDFTVFPEYAGSVAKTLRELRMYDVALLRASKSI